MDSGLLAASAAVVVSYLIGSIPFGMILARALGGVDVRAAGSGNIGATNVARLAGPALGVATLVLDAAKGLGPVLLARWAAEHLEIEAVWAGATIEADGVLIVAVVGAAALVGHCFPVWLRFKGGKGVATSLGVMLGVAPWAALAGLAVFAAAFAACRIVSVGSLLGLAAAIPAAFLTAGIVPGVLSVLIAVLIVARHRENIGRLREGSENRL